MTREEAKELLEQGKRIDEIFTLGNCKHCMENHCGCLAH